MKSSSTLATDGRGRPPHNESGNILQQSTDELLRYPNSTMPISNDMQTGADIGATDEDGDKLNYPSPKIPSALSFQSSDARSAEVERQYLGVDLGEPEPAGRALPIKVLIVASLIALFLLDIKFADDFNVTSLYVIVIFLTLTLQRVRWVLGVSIATIILNLFAVRWHNMYPPTHGWDHKTALNHILMIAGAQVPASILAYRTIDIQRRLERNRVNAYRRISDLYKREIAARAAVEDAKKSEEAVSASLRKQTEQLERIVEQLTRTRQRATELDKRATELKADRDHIRMLTEQFQRKLLPIIPAFAADGKLTLGPFYQPAIQEMQMGGDFYDAIPLPNGSVGLVIGDVAGHGVEAAAQTAFVTTTMRAFATEGDYDPRNVVKRVNRALTNDEQFDAFVSLFYGIYDPATERISYCNAGHEPPVIIRADNRIEGMRSTGLVVGVAAEVDFEEEIVEFRSGDCLVMFTDGMTEAREPGSFDLLGWDAVAKIAQSRRLAMLRNEERSVTQTHEHGDAATDLAYELYQDVLEYAGALNPENATVDDNPGLADDVALMVVIAR